MPKKEYIVPTDVHTPLGDYSHAIKYGNFVWVGGQIALDESGILVGKDDPVAQAEQVYENLRRVLVAAGASTKDLVQLHTFYRDEEAYQKCRPSLGELHRRYLGDHKPTRRDILAGLYSPETLVEVSAVAVIDDKKEFINPANVHKPVGDYSHAIKYGKIVWTSGQIALDENGNLVGKGNLAAQVPQVYENIQRVLAAAGASSLTDILQIMTFYGNREDYANFRPSLFPIRQKYFGDSRPTGRGLMGGQCFSGALITTSVVAVTGGNKEYFEPANVHKPVGTYSHSVKYNGNFVCTAGEVGFAENLEAVGATGPAGEWEKLVLVDPVAQAGQAFENMKRSFEAAGSSMKDVVQLHIMYGSRDIFDKVAQSGVLKKYFGDHKPTTRAVVVDMAFPFLALESSAVAAIDS